MANTQKQNIVNDLIDLLKKGDNFALIKFEKTLHTRLEALRKDLRTNDAKIRVVKNSLLQKALNKLAEGNKELHAFQKNVKGLKENSAVLILGKEWNKGLSSFYNFIKKETTLSFKLGFLDSNVYIADELKKIAQLPSRDELIAKVIGNMKTPIFKLNHSIKFNMQKFVYILSEKSKK